MKGTIQDTRREGHPEKQSPIIQNSNYEAGYHNWFVGNFHKLIITSTNTNKNVPGIRVWILKHWNSQPYVGGGLNRDNTESWSFKNPLRVIPPSLRRMTMVPECLLCL